MEIETTQLEDGSTITLEEFVIENGLQWKCSRLCGWTKSWNSTTELGDAEAIRDQVANDWLEHVFVDH